MTCASSSMDRARHPWVEPGHDGESRGAWKKTTPPAGSEIIGWAKAHLRRAHHVSVRKNVRKNGGHAATLPWLTRPNSLCPDLIRASIVFATSFSKRMDHRVKPGDDNIRNKRPLLKTESLALPVGSATPAARTDPRPARSSTEIVGWVSRRRNPPNIAKMVGYAALTHPTY
jgi:hypothetical protein